MSKDSYRSIILLFLTTVMVYVLPRFGLPLFVNQGVFLLLIAYVYRSRDDLLWLTWFLILLDAPGRLFQSGSIDTIFRLPYYTIGAGLTLTFQELFLAMYLFKLLMARRRSQFIFQSQIVSMLLLCGLFFGISFAFGISAQNVIKSIRSIIPWFWVLIIPFYIKDQNDLKRVYNTLYPMVILAFFALIQSYVTKNYMHDILAGTGKMSFEANLGGDRLARIYSAGYITFICAIMSLYMLASQRKYFSTNLLIFIAFLGTMLTFISGTRGWIIGYLVIYSSFFFVSGFGLFKQLARIIVIVGLSFIVMTRVFPTISQQGALAFERTLTIEALLKGDLTAEGTLVRITEIGPRVMAGFRESPVIGWGFSDFFWQLGNVHVGNQTNLLNGGVVGFTLVNLIYFMIIFKIIRLGRRKENRQLNGNAHYIFVFSLLALFIVHSSSGMLWSMYGSAPSQALWAFLFAVISAEMNQLNVLRLTHKDQGSA